MMFLGDTHGDRVCLKNFLNSEEKYCVQLGDFGFIFKYNDYKYNHFLHDFEKKYPDKTIFTVLGNHENYDSIEKFPKVVKNNAWCWKIRENVFAVERGEILYIENKAILCVGGAESIDKDIRCSHISWWKQERILKTDIEKAILNARKVEKIDIVATHCMPTFFNYHCFRNSFLDESSYQLEILFSKLVEINKSPALWLGGHVHQSLKTEKCGVSMQTLNIGQYLIV